MTIKARTVKFRQNILDSFVADFFEQFSRITGKKRAQNR